MKCGSPRRCASARACDTAEAEQQLRSASFSGSAHSSSVTATVSAPFFALSNAATALSTPPLIATSVRVASGGAASAAPVRAATPSARASASAATSAAWRFAGLRPPSSAAISAGPIRAASSSGRPRTSVTAALPAAWAEPQPSAVKPASVTRQPSVAIESATVSQQLPPSVITV